MTEIRFGCGEFVPGGDPPTVPDLPIPVPPDLDPEPPWTPTTPVPFIPVPEIPDDRRRPIPGDGGPNSRKWKCVDTGTTNTNPLPGGLEWVGTLKECFPCNGLPNQNAPGLANPTPTDPGCIHATKDLCETKCINKTRPVPLIEPVAVNTGGQATPGISTTPTTGGGATGYKCQEIRIICPEDVERPIEEQRILRIIKQCPVCNNPDPQGNTTPNVTASGASNSSEGFVLLETDCIFTSKSQCEAACGYDQEFKGQKCVDDPGSGGGSTTGGNNVNIPTSVVEGEVNPNNGILLTQINIEAQSNIVAPPLPNTSRNTNPSEVYDNQYNFFGKTNSIQESFHSSNYRYTNVFKSTVNSEVGDLLDKEGSQGVWTENSLFSLNLDFIENSINPQLLFAFESIHFPGGQLVGKTAFLEMLRKHLITGTMSEFDADFYITLSNRQRNDTRIQYTNMEDPDIAVRAGLGVIAQGAVLAVPSNEISIRKLQMRRQRRFNTDVRASCDVDVLESEVDKTLFLKDSGVEVVTLSSGPLSVPTGDGDGYYLNIQQIDATKIPLITTNDSSCTYYVPPEVRYNALTLFKEDPGFILTASSVDGRSELVAGEGGASALQPIYMMLDLETLGYKSNFNPLVAKYKGSYVTETDSDIISEHATNNGLSITRVNIDYRDPLYKYILDTGKISLEVNDINFKSIKEPKDYPGGVLISRNLPFGVIVTPVAGSRYNPFNGFSRLDSFDSVAIRSLRLLPSISVADNDPSKSELEEVNLYSDTGGDTKVGLVEPDDTQNVKYKYDATNPKFTNTFFSNGAYTTSTTPVSAYGTSFMVKDVIDYIIDTHNPDDIVWFDVLRRMPINKVGEYLYDNNRELTSQLERGLRNGMSINSLIKSEKDLSSEVLSDDDKVIIKKEDR